MATMATLDVRSRSLKRSLAGRIPLNATDVEVTDRNGRWQGVREWSDHERAAIVLGVRARIVGLIASRDITVIEIDFTNPAWASDHCPPRSTFVHRLAGAGDRGDSTSTTSETLPCTVRAPAVQGWAGRGQAPNVSGGWRVSMTSGSCV